MFKIIGRFIAVGLVIFIGYTIFSSQVKTPNEQKTHDKVATQSGKLPAPPSMAIGILDETGTLSDDQIKSISEALRNVPDKPDYPQIAVYLTPTMHSDTIEGSALAVARAWKVGSAGNKDGALLYIAKNDKKMRIEVADGAGVLLTDAEAGKVIRDILSPAFKLDDYAGGIEKAATALRVIADGDSPLPTNEESAGILASIWSFIKMIMSILLWVVKAVIMLGVFGTTIFVFGGMIAGVSGVGTSRRNIPPVPYGDATTRDRGGYGDVISRDDTYDYSSSSSSSSGSSGGGFSGGGASGSW